MLSASHSSAFAEQSGIDNRAHKRLGFDRSVSTGIMGTMLDDFLSHCVKDTPSEESCSWGDCSGIAVNDVQNLSRESDGQAPAPQTNSLALMFMMNESESDSEPWKLLVHPLDSSPASAQCDALVTTEYDALADTQEAPMISTQRFDVVPLFSAALEGPIAGVMIGEARLTATTAGARERCAALNWHSVRQMSQTVVLEEDQVEKCPICFDCLSKGESAQILPCLHKLHQRCCMGYFRTLDVKPLCPVCRYDMGMPCGQ